MVGMENDIAAAEFSGMVGMEDTAATPVCHGSACPVVCHSEEPGGSKDSQDKQLTSEPSKEIVWGALQFEDRWKEEGMQLIACEDSIYAQLGLVEEDEREMREKDQACYAGVGTRISNELDDDGATMPCEDSLPQERRILYDQDNPVMEPGSLYPSMKEFRIAMRQYAINNKFELGIEATSTTRYRGYCRGLDCRWSIYARTEMKGSPTIIVVVVNDVHTCTSSGRKKTTTPSSAWVAAKALSILMKKPQMGAKELQTILQDRFTCAISYDTIWKGKEKALRELFESWEESFQLLFSWKEAVLQKSPDSVIEIDLRVEDDKLFFSKFFCAFGPCISGFKEGCRPYLSVDSTALNGIWDGHLASATSVDGLNWMYPVAFGFFSSETEENWTWFMTKLHQAVGDLPVLAICSDACKGLTNAVKSVFPNAEKRVCFRHLMNNYVKSYTGSEYMYPAARAYRRDVFEHHIGNVSCDPVIASWLDQYHDLLWYRSGFNTAIKCDYITNNIAELFNNWIKDYKGLPVCDLADKIREMIMHLFHKRRRISQRFHGNILPSIIHVLTTRTRGIGHLEFIKGDDYAAEIYDNSNYCAPHVVKAYLKECSCQEWQHTGKPCQHALCFITAQQMRNVRMEDFVDHYYSVEKFRQAYCRMVEPLEDKSFWPKVDIASEVGAPLDRRCVGRQRENSIKSSLEGVSGKEASEKGKKMIRRRFKCPNCGELGHRKNSSKCPLNGTKKRKRAPRKNTTKGWFPKEVPTSSQAAPNITPPSDDVPASSEIVLTMPPPPGEDVLASSQIVQPMSPPSEVVPTEPISPPKDA